MVCFWLIQAVAPRGVPNPDGIAYLDISYSCLAGNWHALLKWAHLARLKVVAEIPEADVSNFWASAQTERVKAIQWLASSGARVLVTRNVPESAMSMGWTAVPDTDYCILKLPEVNSHP